MTFLIVITQILSRINNLVLCMDTLTGETTERIGIPKSVPSGLSID